MFPRIIRDDQDNRPFPFVVAFVLGAPAVSLILWIFAVGP